ncbi:hypothetical protein MNBD_GAMMA09-2275 [hydrothermal vent metagenome]|uniref:Ubiquinone biosynthesis protein n=1 Tax=hydrothermal vent metagenome TaxID=652676 RepID=A0A3B0XWD6_9ZZZZ
METNVLWEILSGYPTGIYTVLIGVLMVFWLFAIIGALDIDVISFDSDIDFDVDVDMPGFVGLLHTLGFTGVPFTIVLTVLIFLSWVFSYFMSVYIIAELPGTLLQILAGTATLLGSFLLAVPLTTRIISPLRKLSLQSHAKTNKDYLGGMCTVTTLTVDEKFGQGEIEAVGAKIIANIRAESPNKMTMGDIVRPISYDRKDNVYQVIPHEEFEKNLKE